MVYLNLYPPPRIIFTEPVRRLSLELRNAAIEAPHSVETDWGTEI